MTLEKPLPWTDSHQSCGSGGEGPSKGGHFSQRLGCQEEVTRGAFEGNLEWRNLIASGGNGDDGLTRLEKNLPAMQEIWA